MSINVKLPGPDVSDGMSLNEALVKRRSERNISNESITLMEISNLLWAANGITGPGMRKTVPSAGALYPLRYYLAAGAVEGLKAGMYKHLPGLHELENVFEGDVRKGLSVAAHDQEFITFAPASILITALYVQTTARYGGRGIRYVDMEVGHAGQNVYLMATVLGLGTVAVAAFDDDAVSEVMKLSEGETPLYIMPTGRLK